MGGHLKHLYQDTDLYLIKQTQEEREVPSFEEKTLILIPKEITKSGRELLKNILSAIKINIDEAKLIVVNALSDAEFISDIHSKMIFSFGVHKIIDIPGFEGHVDFSIIELGSNKILLSCNLDDLENDREMKMKLWGKLKENFV